MSVVVGLVVQTPRLISWLRSTIVWALLMPIPTSIMIAVGVVFVGVVVIKVLIVSSSVEVITLMGGVMSVQVILVMERYSASMSLVLRFFL